jgi:hypothetical protein
MAYKVVPLAPNGNQSLTCTLPVDGKNLTLNLNFRYNTVGSYWFMSVTDAKTKAMLLDAVPMVTGEFPAAELLGQYTYLGIGSAVIVSRSSLKTGIPDETNLGSDYVLIWGDTLVD